MNEKTSAMESAIASTDFHFKNQTAFYRGKVRDVYTIADEIIVMVASDRISAFDVVLPRPIPFKGQVLNQLAAKMLTMTKDIVPNWLMDVPDPNVSIGRKCEAQPVEMVIRGYLAGHAWREYDAGRRVVCGVKLPDGLKENDRLPSPIITPTTKASEGHDQDISRDEILSRKLVPETVYLQMENYTRLLFERGTKIAAAQGLILVDTKYEFGLHQGQLMVIDEIHTPDSSRYFYSDGYDERQRLNQPQKQLSKEFVRKWLIENGFQGKEGQVVPEMSDEWLKEISERYIELYEKVTGDQFVPVSNQDALQRIMNNVSVSLEKLN